MLNLEQLNDLECSFLYSFVKAKQRVVWIALVPFYLGLALKDLATYGH